ncbi:unnamed protein product [Macrosiphum euphorbiae]|uniref:Envelope protein n=1 Tax=Macrosiphum euphorbiae TaxID=13131 RepID=A0AAV0Y3F1_9HEMI|nr:unnamed protein product [Macrosiphum euphorbiae]
MLILLLLLSTTKTEGTTGTGEDTKITVSPGAFFNEIKETIMYDKSIPLIYTQDTVNDNIKNFGDTWEIEKYCKNKNKRDNYCSIVLQSITLLKNINRNINDNDIDTMEFLKSANAFNTKDRPKRGIQFIGDFYNFCCNVATDKQIKNFYNNEEKLAEQAEKLKDIFVSDHKDLSQITSQLNNYTMTTGNRIELLKNNFKNFVKEEKDNMMLEKINYNNLIQGTQEIMFNIATSLERFINYERDSSTQLHCKLGKIPPRVINTEVLFYDLNKLSKLLMEDGYELVIKLENIFSYYNLPIVECQFSKSKILIKLKIPIKEKSTNWKLFQYIPAHFKFQYSICLIFSEKTYVAVNTENDDHRIVSGMGLQHCDPPITDLCYIPKFTSDITLTPKCVEALFRNLPLSQINKFCYFQFVKQQENEEVIIKQIGVNTFAITNPQPTLMIRKSKKNVYTETQKLKINYTHPGLIKISLPCNYELLRNGKVLIPKMFPCELSNLNKFTIQRILPTSWTNIKSLNIGHEAQKDQNIYFSNLSEILNEDWTKEIPNYHITRQLKDPEEYFKKVILEKMPQPLINYFLGDIIYLGWLTILTIAIGFLAYKLFPVLIKIDLLNPPPIPARQ